MDPDISKVKINIKAISNDFFKSLRVFNELSKKGNKTDIKKRTKQYNKLIKIQEKFLYLFKNKLIELSDLEIVSLVLSYKLII